MKKKLGTEEQDGIAQPGSGADRLEYVADLVGELQVIAPELGCKTLSGLLQLSQSEALLQARAARK